MLGKVGGAAFRLGRGRGWHPAPRATEDSGGARSGLAQAVDEVDAPQPQACGPSQHPPACTHRLYVNSWYLERNQVLFFNSLHFSSRASC